MIISRLDGGLGNQLFQYAAARRLSYICNTELKLDISAFQSSGSLRNYELGHYPIKASIAEPTEISQFIQPKRNLAMKGIHHVFSSTRSKGLYIEKYFHFDPAILTLTDSAYLWGHWQSSAYFQDIRPIILKEFTPTQAAQGKDKELLTQIGEESCPISLHVRRTDYVSNAHTHKQHGVCSLEYYQLAISKLCNTFSRPHFFIFSDDPEWTSANLKVPATATFVNHNGPATAFEDIRLMSACRHFIIANSSFSWWGAWLSQHADKQVIAPLHWFQNSKNTNDLLPTEWSRL